MIDVADPVRPRRLGQLEAPQYHPLFNSIEARGQRLYASSFRGVAVFDLALPREPRLLSFLPTHDIAHDVAFAEGSILVADSDAGLAVLPLECSTGVPALVQSFELQAMEGAVRIAWTLAEATSGESLRLVGSLGAATWDVPGIARSDHVYEAVDRGPELLKGGEVRYTLMHRGTEDAWVPLVEKTISLAPWSLGTRLRGAFPNPFHPDTEIRFRLARAESVELTVYDVAGRRVRTLAARRLERGSHVVRWDGVDDAGQAVASGTYFVRLQGGSFAQDERVTLVR